MQLHDLASEILVDPHAALAVATPQKTGRLRMRTHGDVIVEIQQHRRMLLDGEQQIGEVSQHSRTDGLPLQRAGDSQHGDLVHRDRKVVGPELCEALEERANRCGRLPKPRGGLGEVDRTVQLRELQYSLQRRGIAAIVRRLARCADLAPHVQRLSNDVSRGAQPLARYDRGRARKLGIEPTLRVATDMRQIARPGTEPETVGGDSRAERRQHAVPTSLAKRG